MDRGLDFEAWELLDNITVPIARRSPPLRPGQQSTLTDICAPIDQKEITRWYADYKRGGELAHIASHNGQERAKMQRAVHAVQDDDPILRHMERTLKEKLASNKPFEEHIAEVKSVLANSGLSPDAVQGIKEAMGPRARKYGL